MALALQYLFAFANMSSSLSSDDAEDGDDLFFVASCFFLRCRVDFAPAAFLTGCFRDGDGELSSDDDDAGDDGREGDAFLPAPVAALADLAPRL